MSKRLSFTISLAITLLLAACGGGSPDAFKVDNTQPVGQENRVNYQLNIGAFTPEGTFKAAQGQLARLDTLGIDILWLMPIYPRGATMNSPYAVMDYKAVNPAYGTVTDLKEFVMVAHKLGMKVWLDWVPNHAAVENSWVKEHPEYFTKDAKGLMIHPHGWGDVFELNYKEKGLVDAMNSALHFWVDECDVDGYRCDYVSSPTIPVAYWQNIIAELKSKGKTIEMLSETDISNTNNQRIDSCGFDYDYAWDFQGDLAYHFGGEGTQADTLKAFCEKFLNASKAIKNRRMVYLTNHDQNFNDGGHTLKDFYGDNRYPFTVLQFTFYGMPLIYHGQEIGDPDTLNYFTDAKVKWDRVDVKMKNLVRVLVALHHTQPSLAADAPVEFLGTDNPQVLAYKRGPVVVVLNLGTDDAQVKVAGMEDGTYAKWLDSKTILDGTSVTLVNCDQSTPFALEGKGYEVFVKQ